MNMDKAAASTETPRGDDKGEEKSLSRASDDAADLTLRRCRRCGTVKQLTAFRKFKKCQLGHGHECKSCSNERQRTSKRRYEKYRGRYKERRAAYWKLHPEKNREKASRALKKASAELADSYIRRKLRDIGVPTDMRRSQELIEMKREALIAKRLATKLRRDLMELMK